MPTNLLTRANVVRVCRDLVYLLALIVVVLAVISGSWWPFVPVVLVAVAVTGTHDIIDARRASR